MKEQLGPLSRAISCSSAGRMRETHHDGSTPAPANAESTADDPGQQPTGRWCHPEQDSSHREHAQPRRRPDGCGIARCEPWRSRSATGRGPGARTNACSDTRSGETRNRHLRFNGRFPSGRPLETTTGQDRNRRHALQDVSLEAYRGCAAVHGPTDQRVAGCAP